MDVFGKAAMDIYIESVSQAKLRKGPPELLTMLYTRILSDLKIPKDFDIFYSHSSITIRPLKGTLPSIKCSECRSRILINYDYGTYKEPKSVKFYESVRSSIDRMQSLLNSSEGILHSLNPPIINKNNENMNFVNTQRKE